MNAFGRDSGRVARELLPEFVRAQERTLEQAYRGMPATPGGGDRRRRRIVPRRRRGW